MLFVRFKSYLPKNKHCFQNEQSNYEGSPKECGLDVIIHVTVLYPILKNDKPRTV